MAHAYGSAQSASPDTKLSTDPVDPLAEALHPVDRQDDSWARRRRPSFMRRALGALVRFAIAVGIGVGGTLAWQSYGDVAMYHVDVARERIANDYPQLAWLAPQTAPVAPAAL